MPSSSATSPFKRARISASLLAWSSINDKPEYVCSTKVSKALSKTAFTLVPDKFTTAPSI